MQFERSLILGHCDLLVQDLDVAHLPVWKVELTPESDVARRRQCVIASRVSQILRQGLVIGGVEALMQGISPAFNTESFTAEHTFAEELPGHAHRFEHCFSLAQAEEGRVTRQTGCHAERPIRAAVDRGAEPAPANPGKAAVREDLGVRRRNRAAFRKELPQQRIVQEINQRIGALHEAHAGPLLDEPGYRGEPGVAVMDRQISVLKVIVGDRNCHVLILPP